MPKRPHPEQKVEQAEPVRYQADRLKGPVKEVDQSEIAG